MHYVTSKNKYTRNGPFLILATVWKLVFAQTRSSTRLMLASGAPPVWSLQVFSLAVHGNRSALLSGVWPHGEEENKTSLVRHVCDGSEWRDDVFPSDVQPAPLIPWWKRSESVKQLRTLHKTQPDFRSARSPGWCRNYGLFFSSFYSCIELLRQTGANCPRSCLFRPPPCRRCSHGLASHLLHEANIATLRYDLRGNASVRL